MIIDYIYIYIYIYRWMTSPFLFTIVRIMTTTREMLYYILFQRRNRNFGSTNVSEIMSLATSKVNSFEGV
jgi:hypothetical protein